MAGFTPLVTDRLLLRPVVADDVESLYARRNDPAVRKYQNWPAPYPRENAERLVQELLAMDGPVNDEWYMLTITDRWDGTIYGELVMHMSWQMRTAEVGYTLASQHWGRGYAAEATAALVRYLFEDLGVMRAFGMLHPDNLASARVLERTGFVFEGHTRGSYWDGDEVSDDWIYGMIRSDFDAWVNRPRHRPETVELVPIDHGNESAVLELRTHRTEERFVAPIMRSYADALFPEIVDGAPVVPWLRAVRADADLVGFVMLALPTEHHPEPYLWRLLVDRLHQRRGIGTMVLDLLQAECRAMGSNTLLTSWRTGQGSPEPFYVGYGFEPTGQIIDQEIEGRLRLDRPYRHDPPAGPR